MRFERPGFKSFRYLVYLNADTFCAKVKFCVV
jgi:hypothetical protein